MSENKPNVTINGGGEVAGGSYGTVSINGAGTVTGEITCDALSINGAGTCRGNVSAGSVIVNGTGRFEGTVQASEFKINGHTSVLGGAGIGALSVKGTGDFGGSLAARTVDVRGNISVIGDVEADRWTGEGRFTIGGLLNAGAVDWYLYDRSSAREVGGETISVLLRGRRSGWAQVMAIFGQPRLITDAIEGDSITLEATTAKVVRGGDVVVGEGCEIELVEYAATIEKRDGGIVREERHTSVSV